MQIQFSLDSNLCPYMIRSYQPGTIKINDQQHHHSLILTDNKLISSWPPQSFTELKQQHLQQLLQLEPQIVIIGTGKQQHFLGQDLMQLFLAKNIGLEVMNTLSACRTYNVLMSEGRSALAALLIN